MSLVFGQGDAIRTVISSCLLAQLSHTPTAECHSGLSADALPIQAVGLISGGVEAKAISHC